MRHLQSVVWSKGTFLSPQHLQAQDHFFEESLRLTAEVLSFWYWGFSALQIEAGALSEGRLEIARAAGWFPDGLPFDTAEEAAPDSRILDECFGEGTERVFYLAIPQQRPGALNVAVKREGRSTRFYSEVRMLRDESGSGVEKPVAFTKKNFQIVVEGESLEGLITLPLARVLRAGAGHYRLDPNFIAPMNNIHGSDRLVSILRGMVEVLSSRSSEVSNGRRERNLSLADFSASDVASFWLLYTINTHLPALNGFLQARNIHPEKLFGQMLALSGALTTFSRAIGPLDFPHYEHEKQGSCFLRLERQLMELLATVIPQKFLALPLKQVRGSVYATSIERDEYLNHTRFYLAIAAEIPAADLIARTPALVKVGSATHLEMLIRQALPGLPITHLAAPPQEIPVKLNYHYFRLDQAGEAWELIKRSRDLGVYVPGEIANPRMELILLPVGTHA